MLALGTENFDFELLSPAKKLVAEPVLHAVLPGVEGEIGVGAGHSSLLAALKAGTVKLFYQDREEPVKIFIAGGFADVTGTRCTVLAEEAINVNEIDVAAVGQQVATLRNELAQAADDIEKSRLSKRLALVTARYQAATGKLS
ncbi:MAG: ATP synthase F1 subunit epsilon [Alphaproteobacteria bacterium]